MSLEPEKIQPEIEKALDILAESKGEELIREIRPFLMANLERGRIERFMDGKTDSLPAYVQRVADTYTGLHAMLHQIQVEQSTRVWEPLFDRMQTWAYNFFLRKNFSATADTQQIAAECTSDAALNLLNAYFPYDTDFDAWAHIIVQNACRKYIERAFKKSVVPEDQIVDLDDNLASSNDLPLEGQMLQNESGDELRGTVAQLTESRRIVVQLIYFEGLDAQEAAQRMHKTVGAIYSLQFHALDDLRKILSTIRDKTNE
jgi:RNA polymerase sigma factor (sigma-70 family)